MMTNYDYLVLFGIVLVSVVLAVLAVWVLFGCDFNRNHHKKEKIIVQIPETPAPAPAPAPGGNGVSDSAYAFVYVNGSDTPGDDPAFPVIVTSTSADEITPKAPPPSTGVGFATISALDDTTLANFTTLNVAIGPSFAGDLSSSGDLQLELTPPTRQIGSIVQEFQTFATTTGFTNTSYTLSDPPYAFINGLKIKYVGNVSKRFEVTYRVLSNPAGGTPVEPMVYFLKNNMHGSDVGQDVGYLSTDYILGSESFLTLAQTEAALLTEKSGFNGKFIVDLVPSDFISPIFRVSRSDTSAALGFAHDNFKIFIRAIAEVETV